MNCVVEGLKVDIEGATGESEMRAQRGKQQLPKQHYIEKAMALSKEDAERLHLRVRGRFTRRRDDARLTALEVLALNLEVEDKQLNEWRVRLASIRDTARVPQGLLSQPARPTPSTASKQAI
jgi:hypothetical protein